MAKNTFSERVGQIKMPIRILIAVLSGAFIALIFVFMVLLPKQKEINRFQVSINELEKRLTKIRVTVSKKKEYDEKKALVESQLTEAIKHLPNTKEIPSLLKNITQQGSDSQLEFRLFTPQKERPQGFYIEIPIAVEVSGNYHNVALFFDKVGRMDRIVNIVDVSMQPVKEYSTELITKCTAVTYRFKGGSDAEDTKTKKVN